MHFGHAYALLWNYVIATIYNGKLILRFDDTNPDKTRQVYEDNFIDNINFLDVKYDKISYASKYIGNMIEYATMLINNNEAYVDDTNSDVMKQQKINKIPSVNRENSIEDNICKWKDMINGDRTNCVLRIKIDVNSNNLCLRDPVIFRVKFINSEYKVYPTYDFACPITDYLDNVNCVLRSNEFIDRDAQYKYILNKLHLPVPIISNYKKISFSEGLCSKRKILELISNGIIEDMDDPRLLTMSSLRRMGLHKNSIYQYCGKLGLTSSSTVMKISSLWSINRNIIDKISSRVFAIENSNVCEIKLNNSCCKSKTVSKFIKNNELGQRELICGSDILIDKTELNSIFDGSLVNGEKETLTLINYCNIVRNDDNNYDIVDISHKDTKFKIIWLNSLNSVKLQISKYNYNFNEPIIKTHFIGESYFKNLVPGNIVQIYRYGYYICDKIDVDMISLIEISTK